MEIFNVSTLSKSQILSGIPTFYHIKTLNQKFPSKHRKPSSRCYRNSFPVYLSTSSCRKFQIWAHFGRPTRRRNSLRKKLLDDQQVRLNQNLLDPNSEIQNPSSSLSDIGNLGENSKSNVVEDVDASKEVSVDNVTEKVRIKNAKSKLSGESVLLTKLESWVDQYKKDIEYWGVGSGPIFTVYQDSLGKVKKVSVDEGEILRRSQVEQEEINDFPEVNKKILSAKSLAKEMENGKSVIPKNSSIAKFVVQGKESSFVGAIQSVTSQPELLPKLSRVGSRVLFVFVVLWAVKKLFSFGDKKNEYTEMEKEMMRRKIKSRKEKEMLVKGTVEVIPEPSGLPMINGEKPKLDKEELRNSILKAKASANEIVVQGSTAMVTTNYVNTDNKIQEIREMARRARELESRDHSVDSRDMEVDDPVTEESSNEVEVVKMHSEEDTCLSNLQNEIVRQNVEVNDTLQTASTNVAEDTDNAFQHGVVPIDDTVIEELSNEMKVVKMHSKEDICLRNLQNEIVRQKTEVNDSLQTAYADVTEETDNAFLHEVVSIDGCDLPASSAIVSDDRKIDKQEIEFTESSVHLKDKEDNQQSDTLTGDYCMTKESSVKKIPRVIRSVKEARDYLSKKLDKQDPELESTTKLMEENVTDLKCPTETNFDSLKDQKLETKTIASKRDTLVGTSDSEPAINSCEDSKMKDKEIDLTKNEYFKGSEHEYEVGNDQKSQTSSDHEINNVSPETKLFEKTENWLEQNFHEVEPIIKKIRAGFRDNYMVAKGRVGQSLGINTEMELSGIDDKGGELDWMQDDHLRDIVFQVRDNELSGRDPFYLMDDEDKEVFFRGLEKKVEKENKKLSYLHEWLHSNIENLDYGADGISIYDPPEKIIPRWRGPAVEKIPEVLNGFLEQKKKTSSRNMDLLKKDQNGFAKKSMDLSPPENVDASISTCDPKSFPNKNFKSPKTVIENSDGSVKAGTKPGKEYWQHTKKWSHEFLKSYNAETDPEVKSIMKDIGKDLDRWITEKEIKEAADLMNKLPDMSRSMVKKKVNKIKREMELFGPQAVVSKYREYADEKEEDYLWWLDLSYVLCIELYTIENGEQRVGFYSLEMASDLELEPKPYHVIAFEDPGDCKNLCYIIQAHMDMLGNGNAFVVARPPKDAFREAKANEFGVTVIKKGELQLNIDQPLEEVEEQITEIGSKMYHDKIMKERSVDINSLMKGVFGFSGRPTKSKRSKRKLKKPRKG
ncbi:hypothetical protein L6164_004034 [Bauhinia variegata]|uniref:Uncharacterized protein n=1 Tax=Bauhinia variegata TaxID=167791 RepID=A0ACB9Q356_BAUVA|nr:hypothetical protein L6164_004034 [Bauhinia variegata]